MNFENQLSKAEFLKESVFDLLDLIDRTNRAIERHKAVSPQDSTAIEGFMRLREQHASRLDELMAEFGLHLAKQEGETGEYSYAMAS
ncbi:hypothetical protein [Runella sp.]|uniref:hypothetical protein n=1 Tax=Runella sp. TaxID=1960881 RepID=UPI003D0DCACB